MNTSNISLIVAVVFGLATVFNFFQIRSLKQENEKLKAIAAPQTEKKEELIELAVTMGGLQRFADKLYFAGRNKNWPLASFYLHEIEETAEEIAEAKVMDDGVDISAMMKATLPTPIEQLEAAVKAQDPKQFDEKYELLIRNCNNCHTAAKHEFIEIRTPERPAFSNQKY